jgi:hypothetical protein
MQNIFNNYIKSVSSKFSHVETSEMGYRADFEILLKGIFESINVKRVDHDPKAKQGNKPDFIVINKEIKANGTIFWLYKFSSYRLCRISILQKWPSL